MSQPSAVSSYEDKASPASATDTADDATFAVQPERSYPGSGTRDDPYVVDWSPGDVENPYNWPKSKRWIITYQLALSTFTVSFCSSCYTGGLDDMQRDLHMSQEVAILGLSLYVLGFGLGPTVFAPLSEIFGRRPIFLSTFAIYACFHMGGALAQNAATVLVTRTLAGVWGSAPLTNAGAGMADIWTPRERGVAAGLYATAPFLGPVLGPLIGGWITETRLGWRFNFWIMFMFSAIVYILGVIVTPETYHPALLRKRVKKLMQASGGEIFYVSKFDIKHKRTFKAVFKRNMGKPFVFLATEPIVLFIAIYVSIAYATLYAFFAAYPIVFQEHRHFSPGQGGLTFLGVGLGTMTGTALTPIQNRLYWRAMARSPTGRAPPEARLYLPMVGGLGLPIGIFWFAWTSSPSIPWISPVLAGAPFGIGVAVIMQGMTQYLMDAYGIFCASAIASTVVLRSITAAIFPLICPIMYRNLGDEWACTIFGFLALACAPIPWLFFKYGSFVRQHSRYAHKDAVDDQPTTQTVASDSNTIKEGRPNIGDIEKLEVEEA
ncbi:MFS general substrate transporter [Obba rivulosa]|uniref:MFS general substrate transporter n=1 Tax=Obba rivulosa TaxID=1052685 RepID=A0A8E2DSW8_9APHY|nr:MFS general substrate transporter [Obba rivulosa]